VVMKSAIFWDIKARSLLKVNRRFGGTYRLHLQVRRIREARNQCEGKCTCFHGLLFGPEDGGDLFLRNVG
jgi:hypothetical protein